MSQPFSPSLSSSAYTHGHGHTRNASSYNSAEAGRPSSSTVSSTLGGGGGLTQRSPSPSPTRPTFGFEYNDSLGSHSHSGAGVGAGPSSGVGLGPGPGQGPISLDRSLSGRSDPGAGSAGGGIGAAAGNWSDLTPQRIGRAVGARFMRAVRRGNLPFLLVFFSCTIVFFSALAGVGYHEPLDPNLPSSGLSSTSASPGGPGAGADAGPGEFRVGGPVFDDRTGGLERRIAEQRALEESWAKKRRPKDGAWMRKQRDDKAIRRVRPTATSTSTSDPSMGTDVAQVAGTNEGLEGGQGLEKRGGEEIALVV